MKCPKCGEEIASGFQFCTNCGTPVEQEKPAETKGTPDRLEILAAGMESGGRPEPAAEPAPVSEAPPEERPRPRRRRAERPAPAAEDVPDEPRTPEPAPVDGTVRAAGTEQSGRSRPTERERKAV